MAAIITRSRWNRQPPSGLPDFSHPLMASALFMLSGPEPLNLVGKPPTLTGGRQYVTRDVGIGLKYDSTHYASLAGSQFAGTSGWTIACVMAAYSGVSGSFCGTADGAGSATYDRQILVNASGSTCQAYLYDGSPENAIVSGIVVIEPTIIVATCNGSTLSCYAKNDDSNGVLVANTAVANAGYNGYSTPAFFVGNSSNAVANGVFAPLVLRTGVWWSDSAARAFLDNPWQIFRSRPRRLYFGTAAVVGGTVFNPLSGRGGAAAQPLWMN